MKVKAMKCTKKLQALVLAAALAIGILSAIFPVYAKTAVKTTSGETITFVEKKGKQYGVDADGNPVSGWSKGKKYYFYKDGEMAVGAALINEKFYYFGSKGVYNATKTTKLRKAAKYEKAFAPVKKLIGEPLKSKYYASCYGKGKDGILTYDKFTVYTFKPEGGAEIFMGVE